MHGYDIRDIGNRLSKLEEIFCYLLFGGLCTALTVVVFNSIALGEDRLWLQILVPTVLLVIGSLFLFRIREYFKEKRIERLECFREVVDRYHRMLVFNHKLLSTGDIRWVVESDQRRIQYEKLRSEAPRRVKCAVDKHIDTTLKPYKDRGILITDTDDFDEMTVKHSLLESL